MMIVENIVRWPKMWAASTASVSLLAGAFAIVLAGFGGPAWVFVVLGIWLWTIGLPTTVAVLLLVSLWGETAVSISSSLEFFAVCAVILSFCFQMAFFLFAAGVLERNGVEK